MPTKKSKSVDWDGDCFGVLFDKQHFACFNCLEAKSCQKIHDESMKNRRFVAFKKKLNKKIVDLEQVFNFLSGDMDEFVKITLDKSLKYLFCKGKTDSYYSVYIFERKIMERRGDDWFIVFPKKKKINCDSVSEFKTWVEYAENKIKECQE